MNAQLIHVMRVQAADPFMGAELARLNNMHPAGPSQVIVTDTQRQKKALVRKLRAGGINVLRGSK